MTVQEPDPPDVRLTVIAGIAILSRVLDRERIDTEDIARMHAYLRALKRLRAHLES